MSITTDDVKAITAALAEPFDPKEVKWKPAMVKNNRALAMAYIDARVVMDRLDDVLGVDGWQDEYQVLADNSVMCQLRCRFGSEWVVKTDVGSPSEQPDGGDRMKAAVSDALKRAAVKFGVGRYLYRLASQWVDYDPVKKQFAQTPQLPASALPKSAKQPATVPQGSKTVGQKVAQLTQDYATCPDAKAFTGLEGRRRDLWSQVGQDAQAALKRCSEDTRTRLGLAAAA